MLSTVVLGEHCTRCGKALPLLPLHSEKGGPLMCFMCSGDWHAEHGRRRKWGRIVMKAMRKYLDEGGRNADFRQMETAIHLDGCFKLPGYETDTIGIEVGDITSELLTDMLRLAHPDLHPPERLELAQRVTQALLELKPFTFPAPKPKQVVGPAPSDAFEKGLRQHLDKAVTQWTYPCEVCARTVPYYYCTACNEEWQKRRSVTRERERAKERKYRENARRRKAWLTPQISCPGCETQFKPRRKDATYCSRACRQKAYRGRKARGGLLL